MDKIKLSEAAKNFKLGTYRHYKGHLCEVVGVALHSETLEEMAAYRHDNALWVRPLAMFLENIKIEGKEMPRFEFIAGDNR